MPNPINVSHEDNLSIAYSPANNIWFEGTIDEVRIYNRALSVDEASEHYNGTFSNETGLVGLWHFDEMEGTTANDSSGQENHGTITGADWVEGVNLADSSGGPTGSIYNADPIIKLTTPIKGTYNKVLSIDYSAFDRDPGRGALKAEPIRLYYSDDRGSTWKKVAEDRPNTGVYDFDTTKVLDGTNYKLRLLALDGYNYFGEVISKTFSIDNTGPSFDISVSSASVREKDTITLKIISSEELKASPEMKIIQAGTEEPAVAEVEGEGREFSASYYVERGPGEAVISISGQDLLGNIGQIITLGETFSVERFGPPAPIIKTPSNSQIFTEEIINVIGTSQADSEVVLTLNGTDKFTTQLLANEEFSVAFPLSKDNKGYNTLSIVAFNDKGEDSQEIVLELKLNSEPKISIISVFEKIISGIREMNWVASDDNDDELVHSVEYSNDGGESWGSIVSDFLETSYKIDTSQLADGPNYFLRVTVDDGTEKASDLSGKFTIKNNLPHIALDIPSRYFTNINTPLFTGKVTGSERTISSVKYSLDKGKTWQEADALDGKFNSLIEKIKISISDPLEQGKHNILIKAVDKLNRSVKISRSFNIDTTPPETIIEPSLLEKPVNNSMDTNSKLDGLQIAFQGETEPEAKIELILGDKIYKAVANEKGEFKIKDVTLRVHGFNKFSLSSSDLAANIFQTTDFVLANNPPQISILQPEPEKFLSEKAEIAWQVRDLDDDPIFSQVLFQKEDKEWVVLAEDLTFNIYNWDISEISSGEYKIKIITSDEMSKTEEVLDVFIDNIVPRIALDVSGSPLAFALRPTLSGQARDDFSGIEYVEYSFNDIDWYKALITRGYHTKRASFRFRPRFSLKDGDYKVRTRAIDRAGNIAYSAHQELIINASPPYIGSNLISSGALILFPDKTGAIELFRDRPYKILFSVARDAKEVVLTSQEMIFDLNFNKATLLWESEFNFSDLGQYPLEVKAQDELGNFQTREIALLKVLPWGRLYNKKDNQPIQGAEATLYFLDKTTNSWLIWDAGAFNQENPQKTNEMGEYGFLVPWGKYRLEVSGPGFEKVRSKEFEIENNRLINIDIPLMEKRGIFNLILDYLGI